MTAIYSCKPLTYKQRLELEIVDIDQDLQLFVRVYPQAEPIVYRIRNTLAMCVSLMESTDLRELCSCFGGLE